MLAILVLLPLLSLSAVCPPESADKKMNCPPGCPMMVTNAGELRVTQIRADHSGACCTIESSKPVPEKAATVVVPVVSIERATTSVVAVATSHGHPRPVTDSSPPPFANSQAQLCTFLI